MNERIRILREDNKLSRAAFGEKIGVSGDVINNLERGRVDVKNHIVKLICSEFSVNEDWLRNGTGPMYTQEPTFSLDYFVKSKGATEQELEIVKTYFEIDPAVRRNLMEYFLTHLMPHKDEHPDTPEELESKFPPVEDNKESAG